MCIALILTGKIKVNIRLFISLKSKERFKRNIKPIYPVLPFLTFPHNPGKFYLAGHRQSYQNVPLIPRSQNHSNGIFYNNNAPEAD